MFCFLTFEKLLAAIQNGLDFTKITKCPPGPEGFPGLDWGGFTQHGKDAEQVVILDTSPHCPIVSKKNWVIAKNKQANNKTPNSSDRVGSRDEV